MQNLFSPKQIIESLVLSLLIKEGPLHGYGISLAIEEKFGWKPKLNKIYSTLKALETQKSVTFEEKIEKGRAQKIYSITDEGRDLMVNAKNNMMALMGKRMSRMMAMMQDISVIENIEESHDIQKCRNMAGKYMDMLPFYVFKLMHVAPEETKKILDNTMVSLKDLASLYKVNVEDIEKLGFDTTE